MIGGSLAKLLCCHLSAQTMTAQQRNTDRSAVSSACKSIVGASCCALLGVGHRVSAIQASALGVLGFVLKFGADGALVGI